MKFIKLNRKNLDLFSDLDPFGLLIDKIPSNRFAMGLFLKEQDTNYDYPVGLSVCSEISNDLIIDWMAVVPEFRGHGLGSEMLSRLVGLAAQYNKNSVVADFNFCPARELICKGERIFFMQYGFMEDDDNPRFLTLIPEYYEKNTDPGSVYSLRPSYHFEQLINDLSELDPKENELFDGNGLKYLELAELEKSKLLSGVGEGAASDVMSLSDLNIREQVNVINQTLLSEISGNIIINHRDFNFGAIDIDVSSVVLGREGIDAILLISESTDNTLVIQQFIISSRLKNEYIAYILKHSCRKMTKKYETSCKIYFADDNERCNELINLIKI